MLGLMNSLINNFSTIFISSGGTPDIEILTGGKFIEGAEVCISDLTVHIGDTEPVVVSFKESAEGGVNVADCSV